MKKAIFRFVGAAIVGVLALAVTSLDQGPRLAIGILVGLPSLVLMIVSRRQLGNSFSMMPEAKALITTGLYSRMQHPMYLFLDLFLVALIIILNWPILLLLWAILIIVQALQARREEHVLASSFGAHYSRYQARTWF